ncbi:MAG: tRNA (adenosine(37)-N6)-threonylcarbamoyltransferase complex transferase subunit TsaD [Candidatus Hydrogenedentes bacterium]|nr:tRNA (adenosine(37)-N6)-threonylcarbamoyltransferase complex transferase subunit TsaD [Candidatus Hydrogenedentota bacterium]
MLVLGIETSCDETGVAIVEDGRLVRANLVASQVPVHAKYGGVVPELASRNHIMNLMPLIRRCFEQCGLTLGDVDAVAVTCGPGLVGSLLVGLSTAKSLAYVKRVPLIGVNHIEAHIYANFLCDNPPEFPFLALVASGGHTCIIECADHGEYRLLGQTRDDAAGEAFDKVAKLIGLPYPGGPSIEKDAVRGNPQAIDFPRPMTDGDNLDFSFSGLKTAVLYFIREHGPLAQDGSTQEPSRADLSASFQAAVVDVLIRKVRLAVRRTRIRRVVLAGGVVANKSLRARIGEEIGLDKDHLHIPRPDFCIDNGAMVATAGYFRLLRGERADQALNADPSLGIG